MDYLQVPNSANPAKAKAIEAGWKMQASVMDEANKEGRYPPKYTLLELIGRGSFGLVYKGYVNLRNGVYLQLFH
jgi:serine/threonine protein kinase